MITGQGLLIILAGFIESSSGLEPIRFSITTQLEQTEWQIPPPDEAKISAIEGDTYFVVTNTEINLGLNKLSSDQASNLKNWTHDSNIKNRFLLKERSIEKSSSWWSSKCVCTIKREIKKIIW